MVVSILQWFALRDEYEEIKKEMEKALSECEHSVSLNEFYTLYFLNESDHKELCILDLSYKVGLSLSATSRMVKRFENSCGVITRCPFPTDKRSVFINLTDVGQYRLGIFLKAIEPVLEKHQTTLTAITKK